MSLDELLKINAYDIYNNPDVGEEQIEKIAEFILADKGIELEKYFDLLKCSSKFCWINYLKILEKMPEKDRIQGLPVLFELLQDSNWPTFEKTIEILKSFDKKILEENINKYLEQAYAQDDEMWISNIQLLIKGLYS